MAGFQIGVRCCRLDCLVKPPTLHTLADDPSFELTADDAADTYSLPVPCQYCHRINIIELPRTWGVEQVLGSSFKIVEWYDNNIPVVQGRCLE